ncbi:MAG TPA: DsbE family thiol:disulfide interchange protein [Hyphomicrobiales bacterium]|nr:DsbE family thiol:disulfide interchange protein [Hyphomicrobiales bacterium]
MSNRTKLFIPAAFFITMLGLLFYGLGRDPSHVPSALVNRPLPEFSKPALLDEMSTVDSSELKGGIFLVNVWATWCPTCVAEHAYLLEMSQHEKNVTFVGVNYKDDVGAARDFLTQRGNPFKYNLVDADGRLGIDLGVAAAPETFLVDATGTIRYRHVGAIDNRVWAQTIEPILAQIQ